ncbi:MAG: IS30 family transposase [Carnobacterium sp.]
MSNSTYKHLSLEERKTIESLLNTPHIQLRQIAKNLSRSEKAIRYEITKHITIRVRSNQHNKCGRQNTCCIQRLCTHCISGTCSQCKYESCNELCDQFIPKPLCNRTNRFPYVCSGCSKIEKCKLPKAFYISSMANTQAKRDNSIWKMGPQLSPKEMKKVGEVLKAGIKKKQSIDVVIHENSLPLSTSTAYRHIANRHFAGVINLDLKKQVSYAKRPSKVTQTPLNYDYLEGRRYCDFCDGLCTWDASLPIWEMDTVIGKKNADEKCVLSLLHRPSNLQLYFLLERKDSLEVSKIFTVFKQVLGYDLFKETFPIILTDNGSEFSDPLSLETDCDTGEKLIHVYFCDPRRSDQKGKCEKSHVHFRECVPKGISMNPLSKKDINFISNMVNNYPRKQFNYNTPLTIASLTLNKKVFELNRLKPTPLDQVILTPIIR